MAEKWQVVNWTNGDPDHWRICVNQSFAPRALSCFEETYIPRWWCWRPVSKNRLIDIYILFLMLSFVYSLQPESYRIKCIKRIYANVVEVGYSTRRIISRCYWNEWPMWQNPGDSDIFIWVPRMEASAFWPSYNKTTHNVLNSHYMYHFSDHLGPQAGYSASSCIMLIYAKHTAQQFTWDVL